MQASFHFVMNFLMNGNTTGYKDFAEENVTLWLLSIVAQNEINALWTLVRENDFCNFFLQIFFFFFFTSPYDSLSGSDLQQ